jgi:D-glucosaminate-6-phosphate ammonia-lyase
MARAFRGASAILTGTHYAELGVAVHRSSSHLSGLFGASHYAESRGATAMITRRGIFATAAGLGAVARPPPLESSATMNKLPSVYARLGIRPVINAVGTVTNLGGSIMPPEVMDAMAEASQYFVPLPELQRRVGARIADLLGVPAAMVTAGAASAITVGTVACITRGDPQKLAQLPDVRGMKCEVIQLKSHRSGYESQITLTGATIVEVDTREELERAINGRTAMMFFLNKADTEGRIRRDEWIHVARERGVPTFNDAAADVPPPERLSAYVKEGFDLVAFSGGKGLLGPQCSGLLLGCKELIEAGMPSISPHLGIGRGMKVGKEEIIGLLTAVERYLRVDHDAEHRDLERRAVFIIDALAKSPLRATLDVPAIANHVPHVQIDWEGKQRAADLVKQLLEGDPPIAVEQRGERGLTISVWMMRPDEHLVVARRLAEVFAEQATPGQTPNGQRGS